MTQLVLDIDGLNVRLPESRAYTVENTPLAVDVEMVSGRLVKELRGNVWTITYQYGFFSDEERNRVIAACEKGRGEVIRCGFLPQESSDGALTYSDFFVTEFSRPRFMWSRKVLQNDSYGAVPMWADFSVTLREVKPHD